MQLRRMARILAGGTILNQDNRGWVQPEIELRSSSRVELFNQLC